ncbi:MAG TPA: chromate efflux transporter [Myxococcales bacterium]|nr:chromate efflux transporter [Myxococcales bacterium]
MGNLGEIAAVFLRLGLTAFGGPAAHVALMDREVVEKRRWVTREELVELYGAASLMPGPNSTELAIHLGYRRGGAAGLVLAGACFILPSAFFTVALAWAYVRYGALPAAGALLAGLQPAVMGVVAAAVARLGRSALRGAQEIAVAVAACAAGILRVHELWVLLGAGVLLAAAPLARRRGALALLPVLPGAAISVPGLAGVLLTFLKIGSVLYGSGYVLIAFMRTEFVTARGWLTERQLLDAIAAGQATPGPVSSTATFAGYLMHGWSGAALATLGIFLPAFVFVAASAPLLGVLRRSAPMAAFLRGVNAASIGLVAAVLVDLGKAALGWPPAWIIALSSAALAFATRLDPTWLLLGGGLAGLLFAP